MILSQLLYSFIFFGLLSLIMNIYSKRINAKSPKEKLLTDEEVEILKQEKFSPLYVVLLLILVLVMVGTAVGLVFLSWFLVTSYPKWILAGKSYIALSTNPYGLYLMLLAFFPGILFGSLLVMPLYKVFPNFARYMESRQLKQWGIRKKVTQKTGVKKYVLFTTLATIALVPLFFLVADNYYYVDAQSLHYNPFWGFQEKSLSLDNLNEIDIGIWMNSGNSAGINWEYVLDFKDGEKFNMQGAKMADLKRLDDLLVEKQIPVKITSFDANALEWAQNSSPDEYNLFTQVLNRAQK